MNTILDPLLIFGIGFLPKLGVNGAAIATVLSQIIVNSIFLVIQNKRKYSFNKINFFISPNFLYIKNIIKLGLPAAFQSFMFTLFSMFLARIIANWGPLPIAVQKVGSQIESISWMIASGFSVAISTFVGQNYGANNISRIKQGFFSSFRISFVMGILNTSLLIFFAKPIFSIFIPEEEAIYLGIDYLKILGISQLFM
jgi:putative MATE family efflux protein